SPTELLVGADGQCRFREPPAVRSAADGPAAPTRRRAARGFSAPELYGRCGGRLDARTDVFFAGAVLYYVLARIPPLAEAADPAHRLPPPNVYHAGVPPELSAVARR